MPYNFALTVFTLRNLVADFLQAKCGFLWNSAVLLFETPLGDLGATYDDHLNRLIGKRVVDFLIVLIELFSLGVTAEALRVNIGGKSAISLQRWLVDQTFHVEVVAPMNHFSQKTRLNDLLCDIKIWTDHSSILSQTTRLTDRRTDRQNSRR